MISTLDGKATSGTDEWIFGDYQPLYDKLHVALDCQAWMCGRTTMEMHADAIDTPLPDVIPEAGHKDFIATKSNLYAIAIDTKGRLRWKSNTITLNFEQPVDHHLAVVVTQDTPKAYLSFLREKGISYIFGGEKEIDFEQVFEKLKSTFGIDRLLLEGGGTLNGTIIPSELIDEISLILTPMVANNAAAPAIFEGKVEAQSFRTYDFDLFHIEQKELGTVWLRYKRKG